MGGLGFLIGGAVEGFGKGLAAQGMQDYEERKKIALENLRAQNDRANTDYEHGLKAELEDTKHNYALDEQSNQYDLMDRNASRNTSRTANADISKAKVESDLMEGRQKRVAEFQNNLDLKKQAAQAGIDASQVRDVLTDGETGAVTIVTKGGQGRILPNVIARPKPGAAGGGEGDWRSQLGGEDKPTPAPAAKPSAQAATQPAKPDTRTPRPQRTRDGDKTYSMDDVRETMRTSGRSQDEVISAFRRNGYKLTGQ